MNNNDFYIRNNALQTDNSNKGKKKVLPVLVLVLLVGVAGFLVYELKFKKDDTKKSDEYVEYDPNYNLEDGQNKNEQGDNDGSDDLIDVENPKSDDNSNSNSSPGNILNNIVSNVNKNSNSNTPVSNGKVTGVSINNKNITLYVGQTSRVSATVSPSNATNKNVTWKSSNTGIVTIDNSGNLVAKRVGSTSITVTTIDGGKTSTIQVTVVAKPIAVTGITLGSGTLTMSKNTTTRLTPTITPSNATNKSVTWKSSNTSVATVDQNGKVTAKNYGSATITVTTNDGKKTANVKINVPQPQVSSISISSSTNIVYVGYSLVATVIYYPSDAANRSVTWKSSNPSVATVNYNGTITGKSPGVTMITATTPNGKAYSKYFNVKHKESDYSIVMTAYYTTAGKDTSQKILVGYYYEVYRKNSKFTSYSNITYNDKDYSKNSNFISTSGINTNITTGKIKLSDGSTISGVKITYKK